jgi:hypothetical protein
MSNRLFVISTLVCRDCGSKFPIPRKSCSLRERGHIKDLWCYKCKRVAKFVENVVPQEIESRFALGANNPGFT